MKVNTEFSSYYIKYQIKFPLLSSAGFIGRIKLETQLHIINTYGDFIHGFLNSFPQGPGSVTHQVWNTKALTQTHKLSILLCVSKCAQ